MTAGVRNRLFKMYWTRIANILRIQCTTFSLSRVAVYIYPKVNTGVTPGTLLGPAGRVNRLVTAHAALWAHIHST